MELPKISDSKVIHIKWTVFSSVLPPGKGKFFRNFQNTGRWNYSALGSKVGLLCMSLPVVKLTPRPQLLYFVVNFVVKETT